MKSVLILRAGDVAPSVAAIFGEWPDIIQERVRSTFSGTVRVADLRIDEVLPELDTVRGIVITGSSSSVTERAPWMLRAEEYIRRAVSAEVPLFGICFGHQLVAQALGGEVVKNPRGREIGTITITRQADDPLFVDVGPSFEANATHVDTVGRLPPGARVLAKSPLDDVQAYAVGERVKCVQFHPEIDGDVMEGYVRARRELIERDGLDYRGIAERVRNTPDAARILCNFFARSLLPA